jgi:hypothetical protein
MTQYVKSTSFASKDSLPQGNPLKIVKGTEIDTEFNNIVVAVGTKADLLNPVFTGTPTAATAALGTATTQLSTTAFVAAAVSSAVSKISSLSNFSLVESGTDLLIKHSGVTVAKITSAGALVVKADMTAFGSL